MKKKYYFFITAIFIIVLALFLYVNFNYNIYKLSPEICKIVTGYNPDEFIRNRGTGSLIENEFSYAFKDKSQNAIIIFTDTQKNDYLKKIDNDFGDDNIVENLRQKVEVDVSSDFKVCKIKCSKENIVDGAMALTTFANQCVIHQALDGVKSEEINVVCEIYDVATGEKMYQIDFPNGDSKGTLDAKNYSSMY